MSNNDQNTNQEHDPRDNEKGKSALARLIQGLWRSPLGVLGIAITTFSITLIMIGMIIDMLGLIKNP
ncbi:MAG: hypothetical protein KKC76_03785, partial [Proteobacteria bacterium]|nr:hypothetical protein [Pseudomonadota bacterium]